MGNKFGKILGYTFIISLVLFFVFNGADTTVNPWAVYAKLVCLILGITTALIYIGILIYCTIDNKKIQKMLDADEFDALIAYSEKKASKKSFLIPNRQSYYEYLQLLSYLAKDELTKANEFFAIVEKDMFMYPMTYYWKAILDFTNNDTSKLEENYNNFKGSPDIIKGRGRYDHLTSLLYSLVLFNKGEIIKAKEELEKQDTSNISMPITLRAIKMIKEAKVEEEIKVIEEEAKE